LKAVHNPADAVSLQRILNVPRRGIGDTTIERLNEAAAAAGTTLGETIAHPGAAGLNAAAQRKIADFGVMFTALQEIAATGTCVEVVQAVLDRTRYFYYLKESDPGTFQA